MNPGDPIPAIGTLLFLLGAGVVASAAVEAWYRFRAWRDTEWPDPGYDEDWRDPPCNVHVVDDNVVPIQRRLT